MQVGTAVLLLPEGYLMTGAVALPRQIVDQLRAERGGIVDFAVEAGRIVIVENKCEHHESNTKNRN
jgi:antitoxin component of MazEF toxin-antitoxin module